MAENLGAKLEVVGSNLMSMHIYRGFYFFLDGVFSTGHYALRLVLNGGPLSTGYPAFFFWQWMLIWQPKSEFAWFIGKD